MKTKIKTRQHMLKRVFKRIYALIYLFFKRKSSFYSCFRI